MKHINIAKCMYKPTLFFLMYPLLSTHLHGRHLSKHVHFHNNPTKKVLLLTPFNNIVA